MNFEKIFKHNIKEYIYKLMAKIKAIEDVDIIIKLINIDNIYEKNIFFDELNSKYDVLIKPEIELLTNIQLNEAIKVVANIALINFYYGTKKNKFNFINNKIKKLDKDIQQLIFCEIIKRFIIEGNEKIIIKKIDTNYKEMKEYIFNEFINKLENMDDINNIMKFLEFLEEIKGTDKIDKEKENKDNINLFLNNLIKKYLFTKREFFSNKSNLKISLLYEIYHKGKIEKNYEEYNYEIINLLSYIKKDIEGNISIGIFEEFMKNDESIIKQRLSLIKIISEGFRPDEVYQNLKRKNEEINSYISEFIYVYNNIIIYFKEAYQEIIKKIKVVIENYKNLKLKEFKENKINEMKGIKGLIDKNLKITANLINKVKEFFLFNILYDMNKKKDEIYNFDYTYNQLNEIGNLLKENTNINELYNIYQEIFDKIKEKIGYSEKTAQKYVQDFINYFDITNYNMKDDIAIIFMSKKYELDINGIIFFFSYFERYNKSWNKKLFEKYLNLSSIKDFKEMKSKLLELKNNKLYDYHNIKIYNKLFTCLYRKNEAIDFLFSKTTEDINILKDTILPINNIIDIKDLMDTEKCIVEINKMKQLRDNNEIFNYITEMNEEIINQFENYSKIYPYIIELDRNKEDSKNIYDQIYNIIKDSSFNINQDSEELVYFDKYKMNYIKFTMDELINLNKKINIKNKKAKDEDNTDNDILKIKLRNLIFFKNVISNLEIINEYINDLRNKGSSLPIKINIKIITKNNKSTIKYYLNDKEEESFKEIKKFLLNCKNKYISQLNEMYKYEINLRFLYGKQLSTIIKHIENGINIESIIRYILNNKNTNLPIKEGNKDILINPTDWKNQYEIYQKNSLNIISGYITSLFNNNNITVEEHYNRMKIIANNYKGIYLYECVYNSMEEFIINIFLDKINDLPIGQNILIINEETSIENIQSFFYRALLCNYNTLFVVEINDSISDYQQNIMINYLVDILSYKNKIYNEENEEKIDKKYTQDYLDSFLIFVYNKHNQNIIAFLKEIKKYNVKYFQDNDINLKYQNCLKNSIDSLNEFEKKDFMKELRNIKIITSDISGLGKTGKIKKEIKYNSQKYFYFPLGGRLTKNIIYNKLQNLLNKIKNEEYKDVAIHLDLGDSNNLSAINEFLFSFLITKFYANNENIIYIPNDIFIYIEIPNCFEDYLSKFKILRIFNTEIITLEKIPTFNFPNEIISNFAKTLDIDSNEKLEKFFRNKVKFKKYSYHQINIFIKIFISQYCKFGTKIKIFSSNGKDVSEEIINQCASCTQYFINGIFTKILLDYDNYPNKEKDYLDILSEIYEYDLKEEFKEPLIFFIKEKKTLSELYIPSKESKEYKNTKDYLKKMKQVLNLPNEVEKDIEDKKSLLSILEEKDNTYIIINDTFKKMALLIYRIQANIPVIIMGETGYGKTTLIIKLNQLLNNGKTTLEIININPLLTDEELCQLIKEKNEIAEKEIQKELWLFFNNMNTYSSMSLLKEIFINRTYNTIKLNDNVRLIGACKPFRKRKKDNNNELVYLVNPLPQSLYYYVFYFSIIDEYDEKKYIYNMIKRLFTNEESYLHEITTNAILKCHKYLRSIFDDSIVSLREITRFVKCVDFFEKYFTRKNEYLKRYNNEKNNKLRSIICSIYLCYYIRLIDEKRCYFENGLYLTLLELINNKSNIEGRETNLFERILNEDLKKEIISRPEERIDYNFSDFLKIEQEFIINQIDLNKKIVKNTLLKENVFSIFVSLFANIPLFIIGKSGAGKSLSVELINKSMRGKFSKNNFFQLFPQIIQVYFQGTELTGPKDIENLFKKAENILDNFKNKNKNEELPIIMIILDKMELAERAKNGPLLGLDSKLDILEKEKFINFIGISNCSLNTEIINRGLVLSVPEFEKNLDDIIGTSRNIVENISPKLKDDSIFNVLSHTYFEYKNELKFIKEIIVYGQYMKKNKNFDSYSDNENNSKKEYSSKNKKSLKKKEIGQFYSIKNEKEFISLLKKENKIKIDFHSNCDFYNLIKGVASELEKIEYNNDEKKSLIVNKYIERNFSGIEYKIDLNINISFDDIKCEMEKLNKILDDYEYYNKKGKFKLNSVFLFKKLYNYLILEQGLNTNLIIESSLINDYNLNNCIQDNIYDIKSRYLLLQIKSSLSSLIYQFIKLQNPKKDIIVYNGSPFIEDNNKAYIFNKIINILDDAKDDKLIIIKNLEQIHPFLYDLYNMNYIIKDEKKYARIYLDNEQLLTLVNNNLRIIILEDEKFINNCDLALLSRFEKIKFSFDALLNDNLKKISNNIIEEFGFNYNIKKYEEMNYSLQDLLINCGNEDIQGLIYYFYLEIKNKDNEIDDDEDIIKEKIDENLLREKIVNKVYKILPQDIISILPDNNIIKKKYIEYKNIYSFKDYIVEKENLKYKISIIYTFTNINTIVEELNKDLSIIASGIKSEERLKYLIDEIKEKNENNNLKNDYYINIHFDKSNSKNIEFIIDFILNHFKNDKYNYIMIIHIHRNFYANKYEDKKIYSIPDINSDINQIFIDNLNGDNNIRLNDLLTNDVNIILKNYTNELKLNEEFNKTLIIFLNNKLDFDNLYNVNNKKYVNKIVNYFNEEESIKEKIIDITYKLIEDNKDDKNEENFRDIFDKIYKIKYIKINTIDITSCLIEYIKDLFDNSLNKVFENLDNDNVFNVLYENYKNQFKNSDKKVNPIIIIKSLNHIKSKDKFKYITLFKKSYINKDLSLNDKVAIFTISKSDVNTIKEIINDFITLFEYLYDKRKDNSKNNDIMEETIIYGIINKMKEAFSYNFMKLFENNEGLTVDKTFNIFDYFLEAIYENIKNELNKYKEYINENTKNKINNYFQKEYFISKKDICYAIRLFSTLILFMEEGKENEIQNNNLINYLISPEFWQKDIFNNPDFNKNINELLLWNIQINQIISLYEFLGGDIEEIYFNSAKDKQLKDEFVEEEEKEEEEKGNDSDGKSDDIDENEDYVEDDDDEDEDIRRY